MPTGPSNIYSDLDLDFLRNPISGDIGIKKDLEAVKRSLRNLLLYRKYEKPFQPEFSADLESLLFENNSPVYLTVMKKKIEDSIRSFEPRILDLDVQFSSYISSSGYSFGDFDSNSLTITIKFSVYTFPLETEELNVVLERVR
jgi:phage baseplate assembly protein W